MSSSIETKSTKKRAGRKRLPPLPPGPNLQFVVANHPEDFRADATMRHVRSHVMYKHRGASPKDRPKSGECSRKPTPETRTPSPTTYEGITDNDNYLVSPRYNSAIRNADLNPHNRDCFTSIESWRSLSAKIITTIASMPAQGTPTILNQNSEYPFQCGGAAVEHVSLDELRVQWINLLCSPGPGDYKHDKSWTEMVCSNNMAFLSHVSFLCAYQDIRESFLEDSPLTVYAKTQVISRITQSLTGQRPIDKNTIISILHLLVSEIGGQNEDVFDVHLEGLMRIIHERGGLTDLGPDDSISTTLVIIVLTFAILRGRPTPIMLNGFVPSSKSSALNVHPCPISPLYAPIGDLLSLRDSCSNRTYDVISDMHNLTQTFVHRGSFGTDTFQSDPHFASFDNHMQQIYTRLLLRTTTENDAAPDWIYESCRLAALIYCGSIVQGLSFSESANTIHATTEAEGGTTTTTLIRALHNAIVKTDIHGLWGDMCGVLLWVYHVGGSACWPKLHQGFHVHDAWPRKWFALFAVKSAFLHSFTHTEAVVEAQRKMLQIQHLIRVKRGMVPQ